MAVSAPLSFLEVSLTECSRFLSMAVMTGSEQEQCREEKQLLQHTGYSLPPSKTRT